MNRKTLSASVRGLVMVWVLVGGNALADDTTPGRLTARGLAGMCKEGRGTVGEAFCAGFFAGIKLGIEQTPEMLKTWSRGSIWPSTPAR
jgi:hypothetical protein